jgi:hypothetical protein
MKLEKLLNNKNVLYLVVALAVLCSLGYLCVSSYECLAVFAVVYFICCNYVKNKVICIVAALFVSNFLFGCSMSLHGSLMEGYANPENSPVTNPSIAGEIAEVAGNAAAEEVEEAVAKQGGSEADQKVEGDKAKEEVKKAVVESLRNMA